MSAFVDTSALFAMLDVNDVRHKRASAFWRHALTHQDPLYSSNYVLLETFALMQKRLGLEAVSAVQGDVVPWLDIQWIDELTHQSAVRSLMAAARRDLSLVDCTSFEVMRRLGVTDCFCFDAHFKEQGFRCLP